MDIKLTCSYSIKELSNYYDIKEEGIKFKTFVEKGTKEQVIVPIITPFGIVRAKWGLVPRYIPTLEKAQESKVFEVDSHNILTDKRVRGSIRSRRCLIPINYYISNSYKVDLFFKKVYSLGAVYDV